MVSQLQIDPNDLIDPSGVGWEEGLLAAAALVIAVIVGAIARRLVRTATSRWFDTQPDVAIFLGRLAGWFVVALGIVAAMMVLGFQLGPVFLLVTVVAVILVLSARTLLENFGAGVVLQTENPFHLGDLVELGLELGVVKDITGRTTVIDTYDGRRIRIPNSEVLRSAIVNFSERKALATELTVGLAYGTDLDTARKVLLDTLGQVEGVYTDPAPEVFVAQFSDSSISFTVRFWHEPTLAARYGLTDHVSRAVDAALRGHGLVIAFPQIVVHPPDTGKPPSAG